MRFHYMQAWLPQLLLDYGHPKTENSRSSGDFEVRMYPLSEAPSIGRESMSPERTRKSAHDGDSNYYFRVPLGIRVHLFR